MMEVRGLSKRYGNTVAVEERSRKPVKLAGDREQKRR
jgi:hypothetical protein